MKIIFPFPFGKKNVGKHRNYVRNINAEMYPSSAVSITEDILQHEGEIWEHLRHDDKTSIEP
jgi:hypothetical protein